MATTSISTRQLKRTGGAPSSPLVGEDGVVPRHTLRLTWQLKTMLPVVAALFNGLILFVIATVSLAGPERHTVLLMAAIGAIIVCAVMVVTLALVVRRPMLELENSIHRVS